MAGINFPQINSSIIPAPPSLTSEHKVLFIGLAGTGTYTSGQLYHNVDNNGDLRTMVGVGSPLGKALSIHNTFLPSGLVSILPLEQNAAGTAATGSIAVANTASASGDVRILVGGSGDIFTITIAQGDTATVVAGKIRTAINARTECLVTASGTGDTVDLTANQKGLHGNYINLVAYTSPLNTTGCTFTLTEFSGGAGEPTYPALSTFAEDERFNTVICLSPDTTVVRTYLTELDARFNVQSKVMDGVLVASIPTTTAASGDITTGKRNTKAMACFAVKEVDLANQKGLASKRYCFEDAAIFGSFRQLKFTNGSFLTSYVQNGGQLDILGGVHQSAKPYPNTILAGWELPEVGTDYSEAERATLKRNGLCCIGVHRAGQYVTFSEVVTPYSMNTQGLADNSFTYLEYVDSLVNCRKFIFDSLLSRYAQSALASKSSVTGFAVATKAGISGEMLSYFSTLSGEDYILLDAGAVGVFTQNLYVELDKRTGRVSISCVLPIITQLRRIDLVMALTFEIDG